MSNRSTNSFAQTKNSDLWYPGSGVEKIDLAEIAGAKVSAKIYADYRSCDCVWEKKTPCWQKSQFRFELLIRSNPTPVRPCSVHSTLYENVDYHGRRSIPSGFTARVPSVKHFCEQIYKAILEEGDFARIYNPAKGAKFFFLTGNPEARTLSTAVAWIFYDHFRTEVPTISWEGNSNTFSLSGKPHFGGHFVKNLDDLLLLNNDLSSGF
jgi:hypothetical protein